MTDQPDFRWARMVALLVALLSVGASMAQGCAFVTACWRFTLVYVGSLVLCCLIEWVWQASGNVQEEVGDRGNAGGDGAFRGNASEPLPAPSATETVPSSATASGPEGGTSA